MATELGKRSLTVTLVSNGCTSYAGTPSASGFGAVYVDADSYNGHSTMVDTGQSAILDAWTHSGTGVVLSAATTYIEFANTNPTLTTLQVIRGSAFVGGTPVTSVVPSTIWGGLPTTFTPVDPSGILFCEDCTTINGSTVIARTRTDGGGVVGVAIFDGVGRTAALSGILVKSNFDWSKEPDYVRLLANSLKWSARCLE